MECLICNGKIQPGEEIFYGNQVEYSTDGSWSYSKESEGLVGAIHLMCLRNPVAATRMSNTATPEFVGEEFLVQRSDALSLLEGSEILCQN
ncbi:hypothetical protein LCGC14_0142400 [marine sediment metagenome]|uniref:Uncharacterized protein n=1 Tax=marine sediment metagenome TaxID=412755 RepID=A0A0F9V187_9ZZZZ